MRRLHAMFTKTCLIQSFKIYIIYNDMANEPLIFILKNIFNIN